MGEKDAKMWGQHNIYWSLYAACQVPAPRRMWYNGVPVAPRSEILIFVGWSSGAEKSEVDEDRTSYWRVV
jgi:hypothetical protein